MRTEEKFWNAVLWIIKAALILGAIYLVLSYLNSCSLEQDAKREAYRDDLIQEGYNEGYGIGYNEGFEEGREDMWDEIDEVIRHEEYVEYFGDVEYESYDYGYEAGYAECYYELTGKYPEGYDG